MTPTTATTERVLCQLSTCSTALRVLAEMLGSENTTGIFAIGVARFFENKRERWTAEND